MIQNVHTNSIRAYRQEGRHLKGREMQILRWLAAHPGSYTDREIQQHMGFRERSAVQPRISELIASGLAIESGKVPCRITGKRVRSVTITQKGLCLATGRPLPSTRYKIPAAGQCTLF